MKLHACSLLCVKHAPFHMQAHSCSRRFSSNYVGDATPKHSSGCGFLLTNLRHNSAQGPICAMHTSSFMKKVEESRL